MLTETAVSPEFTPIPPEYVSAMAEKMRRHIERKIFASMNIPPFAPKGMIFGPRLGRMMSTADYLFRKPASPPAKCGPHCHCKWPNGTLSLALFT
jgi:hypothetical protein